MDEALWQAFQAHMAVIGRKGGLVKSERKAKAARRNGKKGGRPKEPTTYQELRVPGSVSLS